MSTPRKGQTALTPPTITIQAEAADMWGGEDGWTFNYAWCRRTTLIVPAGLSDAAITRRVKAALELTGTKCHKIWESGQDVAYRVAGQCVGFNWRVED